MAARNVPLANPDSVIATPRLSRPNEILLGISVALALLIPCFWQRHIQAGDLASHVYNAWLAGQIENGAVSGLTLAHPLTNVLADWALQAFLYAWGPAWAARLVAGAAVETFFWGAFYLIATLTGARRWMMVPSLTMLAYGLIFHFGFLNFYLSTGLCLWIMALLWNPTRRRLMISIPLAALALLAHALPLAWAAAALIYVHIARRLAARQRVLLLVAGVAFVALAQIALIRMFQGQWSSNQLLSPAGVLGLTGVEQFWIYGSKYAIIGGGMLLLWFLLFLQRVDRGGLMSDPLVHLWILNMTAFALLPSGIQLPQFQFAFLFVPERISLFVAILFCAVVGGAAQGRGITRLTGLLAVTFFTFLYLDVRAISAVDAELGDLVSGLPPGQRVVASLADSGSSLNGLVHVLDWACVGHCLDYANYEPATGQFRIRVLRPNSVVAPDMRSVQQIEYGHHIVTPQEAPLYSICPSDGPGQFFLLRKLSAGDPTCGFSLPTTPQFFRDGSLP